MSSLESTERLAKLGFDQKLVAVLAKNDALSNRLLQIYSDRSIEACSEQKSHLLYTLCAGQNAAQSRSSELIADLIFADKILTKHQVKLAEEYLQKHAQEQVDVQGLEQYCGVGVEIEDQEVKRVACQFVERYRDKIREKGYRLNCPDLLNELKRQWTIANPADLIRYANEYLTGIRQQADPEPQPADAKQPPGRAKSRGRPNPDSQESGLQKVDLAKLTARDLCESLNSPELLQAHQQATQGKIITRFPPEPNGILHIGHARAIRFNFSISGVHQGECNLRYDDTNPETEKKEYMDMIEENVRWMGFEPTRIVHASHYFEKIFELTLELIRQEKAYVCKLPQEVMRRYKQEQVPSPYRETDAATNLREFELMRRGFYGEGEAVLRAKIDYRSANTTLRDPVLYRVLFTPHPVTGTRWCIYPMYDYAHPLSDSLEHVTHSCCTLEFETRRDLYYWPLQQLNLFKPFVWEFSRLNLTFTLTSKRKIARLIEDRAVAGWNDPRLFTIEGLKRRGVPVEALNEFLDRVPVTRRGNENYIQMELFESVLRSHLDRVCERVMGVVDPVALTLSNLPVESCLRFEALHHPPDSRAKYQVHLEQTVFVERADVREAPEAGFQGLCPGRQVRLKYGPVVQVLQVARGLNGQLQVRARLLEPGEAEEAKGCLHWISRRDAEQVETRLYQRLFLEEKPVQDAQDPADRQRELNPHSLTVRVASFFNREYLGRMKWDNRFQLERLGYFFQDSDSRLGSRVFNLVIDLQHKANC